MITGEANSRTGAPAVGTVVQYELTEYDAVEINKARADHHNYARTLGQVLRTGHVGHVGNGASKGDIVAAVVVRVFNETSPTANLQLLLDGNHGSWKTSVGHGLTEGTWRYIGETPDAPAEEPAAPAS